MKMLKPIQLAVQLIIANIAIAVIQEPTLYKFCRHTYMDMLGDMPVEDRIKNDYCEQKIEVVVANKKEAKSVCRRVAPFRVKEATHESDGTVRCKWESSTTCEEKDDVLVYNRCFRLGGLRNASTASSGCTGKLSFHSVKSRDEAKFLSVLLSYEDPIHVANSNSQRPFNMIDRSGLLLTTRGFEVSTSSLPDFVALNLFMLDLENIPPGMLIEVAKDVQLRPLCSRPSVLYGKKGHKDDTVPQHLIDHQTVVNGNVVIRTANVYQPDAKGEREGDVSNFHKICQNICEECFAVLPNMKGELAAQSGIHFVAGIHKKSPWSPKDNANGPSSCRNDPIWKENRDNFQTRTENGNTSGVEPSRFAANYPNNMCADGLNTALISMPNADLHDSPTITRHPILCVKGTKPDEKPFSQCRENSEQTDDGGCKCKPGFLDAANNTINEMTDYVPGQLCYAATLGKVWNSSISTAIIFLMDFSELYKRSPLIEFVKMYGEIDKSLSYIKVIGFAQRPMIAKWIRSDSPYDFEFSVPTFVREYFHEYRITLVSRSGRHPIGDRVSNMGLAMKAAKEDLQKMEVKRKIVFLLTNQEYPDDDNRNSATIEAQQMLDANVQIIVILFGRKISGPNFYLNMVHSYHDDIFDLSVHMTSLDDIRWRYKLSYGSWHTILRRVYSDPRFNGNQTNNQ